LSEIRWHYRAACNYPELPGYAVATIDGRRQSMHRFILRLGKGKSGHPEVDHINGNTLDNRKPNLRFCTPQQSSYNRRSPGSSGGYKGVFYYKDKELYRALIRVDGKNKFLGNYCTAEEAARAYDIAAEQLHGAFALTNGISKDIIPKPNNGFSRANSSGYRGVSWCFRAQKWVAQINVQGKRTGLGYFETAIDAARAYDDSVRLYGHDLRRLNFPSDPRSAIRRNTDEGVTL
jgi:hypothetical protein